MNDKVTDKMEEEFIKSIKNATDDQLREFFVELFPSCASEDGDGLVAMDVDGLSDDFWAGMRDAVDQPDAELFALDDASAEALGIDPKSTHQLYEITARHQRLQPEGRATNWKGSVSAVRVSLPENDSNWTDVGTRIGKVLWKDHKVHSRTGLRDAYIAAQRELDIVDPPPPPFNRVDLITGARLNRYRFAPVSLLLAYQDDKPAFYAVESANVVGKVQKLFIAFGMDDMHNTAGYAYTFMAHSRNLYDATLTMDASGQEPKSISLHIRLPSGPSPHLHMQISFAKTKTAKPVRLGYFWEAARRAAAIAWQLGYHPKSAILAGSYGLLAERGRSKRYAWDIAPQGDRPVKCLPYVNCYSSCNSKK